jgi:ATP-dependent Clp protease ATP-binding subunit ClpB
VDFKNTLIIMTSNLGSQLIRESLEGVTDTNRSQVLEKAKDQVFDLLKRTIRPEFLNRVDEIIMFAPLTKEEIVQVVKLQVAQVAQLLEKNDITLTVTDKAERLLADTGYDPQFGARPIKRVIQKMMLNEISKEILSGRLEKDAKIVVDEKDGDLVFRNE